MDPRALYSLRAVALLAALASCAPLDPLDDASHPDHRDLEQADPDALTWVSPTLAYDETGAERLRAGEPLDLTVATEHDDVEAVRFYVDGALVGECRPGEDDRTAGSDCAIGAESGLWQWTVRVESPGRHALAAEFTTEDGAVVRTPARAIEVAAADEAPLPPVEEAPEQEQDPLAPGELASEPTDTLAQPISVQRGYLDPGSRGFRRMIARPDFRGLEWRVEGQRVLFRGDRAGDHQLHGDVEQVARCVARIGVDVRRFADRYYVSRASVVALAVAASDCGDPDPDRDDAADGPASANVTGLSAARCAAVTGIAREECARRLRASPSFAVESAVRFVAARRRAHHNDPPRLAAVYFAGGVRRARGRWGVAAGGLIDAFVGAYNAYRTWEARGAPAPAALADATELERDELEQMARLPARACEGWVPAASARPPLAFYYGMFRTDRGGVHVAANEALVVRGLEVVFGVRGPAFFGAAGTPNARVSRWRARCARFAYLMPRARLGELLERGVDATVDELARLFGAGWDYVAVDELTSSRAYARWFYGTGRDGAPVRGGLGVRLVEVLERLAARGLGRRTLFWFSPGTTAVHRAPGGPPRSEPLARFGALLEACKTRCRALMLESYPSNAATGRADRVIRTDTVMDRELDGAALLARMADRMAGIQGGMNPHVVTGLGVTDGGWVDRPGYARRVRYLNRPQSDLASVARQLAQLRSGAARGQNGVAFYTVSRVRGNIAWGRMDLARVLARETARWVGSE